MQAEILAAARKQFEAKRQSQGRSGSFFRRHNREACARCRTYYCPERWGELSLELAFRSATHNPYKGQKPIVLTTFEEAKSYMWERMERDMRNSRTDGTGMVPWLPGFSPSELSQALAEQTAINRRLLDEFFEVLRRGKRS